MADDVKLTITDDAGNHLTQYLDSDPPHFIPGPDVRRVHIDVTSPDDGPRRFHSRQSINVHPGITYGVKVVGERATVTCPHGTPVEHGSCVECDRCPSTHRHNDDELRCVHKRGHVGEHFAMRDGKKPPVQWP